MPQAATTLVKATALLTVTGQPSDTNTVTVGGKVYTFQTSLTDSDGNVLIGTDAEDSIKNLRAAVNLGAGSGTKYAASMTVNPYARAADTSATVMTLTAETSGTVGNLIDSTETHANGSFAAAVFQNGAGTIKAAIDELQAEAQLNSDVLEFLALMEA